MLCSLLVGVTIASPPIIQAIYVTKTVAAEPVAKVFT